MATDSKSSLSSLFNNATLSDVKIKQIYKGKVREYFAHKAILCKESEYFMKAFTGGFKEATDSTMELHDDDPELFEIALRYVYTDHYDKDAVLKLAGSDKNKRIFIPIGIYSIADKYSMTRLFQAVTEDFQSTLETLREDDTQGLTTTITKCFEVINTVGTTLGRAITAFILNKRCSFIQEEAFRASMIRFPIFGTEMSLLSYKALPHLDDISLAICDRRNCKTTNTHNFANITSGRATITCRGCTHQFTAYVPSKSS